MYICIDEYIDTYIYVYKVPEDVPLIRRIHGLVDFVDDAEGRYIYIYK